MQVKAANRTGIDAEGFAREVAQLAWTQHAESLEVRSPLACAHFIDVFLDVAVRHFDHPENTDHGHRPLRERLVQAAFSAWVGWCGDNRMPEHDPMSHSIGLKAHVVYRQIVGLAEVDHGNG